MTDGLTPAGSDGAGAADGATSPDGASPLADVGPLLSDPQWLYDQLCVHCHGSYGEGGLGPSLIGLSIGKALLTFDIEDTMPASEPELCVGECAELLAGFILDTFKEPAPAVDCDELRFPPQQLRLLNRREYAQTVRDLLWPGSACDAGADCDLRRESCVAGVCSADPCGRVGFVFDPGDAGYAAVHVAGTFNAWAPTVAEGGWPLTWEPSTGVWVGKQEVAPGDHAYKFVADGQWLQDPDNPDKVANDFGGFDSLLVVDCEAANPALALEVEVAATLPPESRPEGFAYDTHGRSARVTAVHVDAYLAGARTLADLAAQTPWRHVACNDPSSACAEQFVTAFGRRAFRRPLGPDEVTRYRALVASAESFEDGVGLAIQAMLTSPLFLYRSEVGSPAGDGTYRLDPWETASALSYALWGTMPDEALFAAAQSGTLDVDAQARRLLTDDRARSTLESFAVQWLGVVGLESLPKKDPGFSGQLAAAMLAETRRFFSHVVFEGSGRFEELLSADYTFADAQLAQHYGLPDGLAAPAGAGLVETPYSLGRRAGLLGHGSLLASTAHSDQTSPIRRGLMVRRTFLCQELPPPPPDAGGVPEVDPTATTRERFRQHTDDPTCYSCHRYIDDLGFGFERFGPTGRWRETDNGAPIDASGNLNDVEGLGTKTDAPYETIPQLAEGLAEADTARRCFASQYYRFATGRLDEEAVDGCHLDAIDQGFAASGGTILELVVGVVTSDAFVRRSAPGATE